MDETADNKGYDKPHKAYEKLGGIFNSFKSEKSLKESLEDTYGIWKDNPKPEEAIKGLRKEWKKWDEKLS